MIRIRPVLLFALAFLLAACNLPAQISAPPGGAPPVNTPALPASTPVPPTSTVAPPPPPTETPSPEPSPTPTTSSEVIITAASGNLNIRRGPAIYYNVVTSLAQGQSARASGRDAQGYWLYVAIPANPSAFGWISTQTSYSSIEGDINSLPVIAAPAPLPATIRNCTFHPMQIEPGGVVLPPQTSAPANAATFAPGNYTATDQSVAGSPSRNIALNEGTTVDINTDGLNNNYTCP
ncbi:MAG: hypothetical protein ABWK53_03725 [Anaerolineales bacterium]